MQRGNGRLPMLSLQNKCENGNNSKLRNKLGDQNSKNVIK